MPKVDQLRLENAPLRLLDSKETESLCQYKNKVILAVNVASRCGYTPQYTGLQNLYEELKDEDFTILAFPSRDFMWQEFCRVVILHLIELLDLR